MSPNLGNYSVITNNLYTNYFLTVSELQIFSFFEVANMLRSSVKLEHRDEIVSSHVTAELARSKGAGSLRPCGNTAAAVRQHCDSHAAAVRQRCGGCLL